MQRKSDFYQNSLSCYDIMIFGLKTFSNQLYVINSAKSLYASYTQI